MGWRSYPSIFFIFERKKNLIGAGFELVGSGPIPCRRRNLNVTHNTDLDGMEQLRNWVCWNELVVFIIALLERM